MINTMFIFRYFSNDVLLFSVSTRVVVCIQLFREKLSEKVYATITKGIVGGFEFAVLQRNLFARAKGKQ